MKIGVLSLQGDFAAHGRMLARVGAEVVYVREPAQLAGLGGVILPGGESTTMLKLLDEEKLFDPLVEFAARRPLFGTCAGTILMAREVSQPQQRSMNLLDIAVERNAYGRQVDSSIRRLDPSEEFLRRTAPGDVEGVFIRAPIIRRVGPGVRVLARQGEDPVLIEQDHHMAATFHPELTDDERVHRLFLDLARSHA
jgi:pyridoxal 5'-phosphate synthase pdxT subunit